MPTCYRTKAGSLRRHIRNRMFLPVDPEWVAVGHNNVASITLAFLSSAQDVANGFGVQELGDLAITLLLFTG